MSGALLLLPVLLVAAPGMPTRVERPLFVKEGRWLLSVSASDWARADYAVNLGVAVSGAWYPRESDGVELDLGRYFSSLDGAAARLFEQTGFVPDVQRPAWTVLVGWRHTLGIGKLAFGAARDQILHFELQSALRLGAVRTDRAWNPELQVGPALLVRLSPWLHLGLEVCLVGSLEQRTSWTVPLGLAPRLSAGLTL